MSVNHPLFWLAIVTFLIAVAYAVWSYLSISRRQKHGSNTGGVGGPNDPLA